jgi:RNA polymerase sigma factor (sigma-70 family)
MSNTAISFTSGADNRSTPLHSELPVGLRIDLERRFAQARSRLLRLARLQGVMPDTAEDIAQETLLIAWWRIDTLQSPEHLDAWLDGICRNLCLHQLRDAQAEARRQASRDTVVVRSLNDSPATDLQDMGDPLAGDPLEELTHQDLQLLLGRALGYLPSTTREAVELRYLADLSPDTGWSDRLPATLQVPHCAYPNGPVVD